MHPIHVDYRLWWCSVVQALGGGAVVQALGVEVRGAHDRGMDLIKTMYR